MKTVNVLILAIALIALVQLSNCTTANKLQKENFLIPSQRNVKHLQKLKDLKPWEGFRGWSPRNPY
tara:strand:+ start:592 stop:789 length:198 start_codon:yes stop_codon:yes gene_type:complete